MVNFKLSEEMRNDVIDMSQAVTYKYIIHSSVKPLHNGHLGDRRKWPL